MKRLTKTFLILGTLCFSFSSLFSSLHPNAQKKECSKKPAINDHLIGAYNAPACYSTRGSWHFFLSGSFLFLESREKGLDLAHINPDSGVINSEQGSVIHMDFSYHCGFKAGLGLSFSHDNWLLYSEYTRVHINDSVSEDKPSNGTISPHWLDDGNRNFTISLAKGHWSMDLDIIDLQLARPYYLGKRVTIKPHVGARGGWIDQNYTAKYTNNANQNVIQNLLSQDTWLIGPRFGFNGNWLLGHGIRFLGDFASSLFYQSFRTSMKEYDDATPSDLYAHMHDTAGYVSPNLEMMLGLGWGRYLDKKNWHIDLLAGYSFQIFWNQNAMRSLKDSTSLSSFDGPMGNLMLHGLTITARFDF